MKNTIKTFENTIVNASNNKKSELTKTIQYFLCTPNTYK